MPGPALPAFLARSALLKMGKKSMKNSKTAKALEGAEKKVPKMGKSAAQKFKDKYTK